MKQLTPSDSSLLKGIGIICIVLHNFCHLLPYYSSEKFAIENEYTFSLERTYDFFRLLGSGSHVLVQIFSYAGHYGVPLFLFVSGYGLVKKYESTDNHFSNLGLGRFMWYNCCKFWRLLWLGLVIWIFSDIYIHQGNWPHHYYNILQLLTFTGNLFPDADLLVGPWWYFSLTIQLYLVYRLLFWGRGWKMLFVTNILMYVLLCYAVESHNDSLLNYLRYNCFGSLLPFSLGIAMARYRMVYSARLSIIAIILWIASWFAGWAWLFSPSLFLLAILPVVNGEGTVRNWLCWVGAVSSSLFMMHPIVRPYFLILVKRGVNIYVALGGYLFLSCLTAIIYKKFLDFQKKNH